MDESHYSPCVFEMAGMLHRTERSALSAPLPENGTTKSEKLYTEKKTDPPVDPSTSKVKQTTVSIVSIIPETVPEELFSNEDDDPTRIKMQNFFENVKDACSPIPKAPLVSAAKFVTPVIN